MLGKEPNPQTDQSNIFFQKCNNEEWKHKDRILRTKNEIKTFLHFVSKEHQKKHWIHKSEKKNVKSVCPNSTQSKL